MSDEKIQDILTRFLKKIELVLDNALEHVNDHPIRAAVEIVILIIILRWAKERK